MTRITTLTSPLLLGFEEIERMVEKITRTSGDGYPPYNIEKFDDENYAITMAVAGFAQDDIDIEIIESNLTVVGKAKENAAQRSTYLHRGIAQRGFQQRFRLADNVEVSGANLENGLLQIELRRIVPEAAKPRRVAIGDRVNALHAPANAVAENAAEKVEATAQA